jgi:hypothetical protein
MSLAAAGEGAASGIFIVQAVLPKSVSGLLVHCWNIHVLLSIAAGVGAVRAPMCQEVLSLSRSYKLGLALYFFAAMFELQWREPIGLQHEHTGSCVNILLTAAGEGAASGILMVQAVLPKSESGSLIHCCNIHVLSSIATGVGAVRAPICQDVLSPSTYNRINTEFHETGRRRTFYEAQHVSICN